VPQDTNTLAEPHKHPSHRRHHRRTEFQSAISAPGHHTAVAGVYPTADQIQRAPRTGKCDATSRTSEVASPTQPYTNGIHAHRWQPHTHTHKRTHTHTNMASAHPSRWSGCPRCHSSSTLRPPKSHGPREKRCPQAGGVQEGEGREDNQTCAIPHMNLRPKRWRGIEARGVCV
jgi:hypothetical protein